MDSQTHDLTYRELLVQGRGARYSVVGAGSPVVFLHGWALAHHSYRKALARLAAAGMQVFAPGMPGFGGTADLPAPDKNIAGYSRWVSAFATEVGIDEPFTLVGHSLGGGIAIQTAHDFPDQVARLIVINSIGGSAWSRGGVVTAIRERPLWDWGLHLQADLLPLRQLTRVLPVIIEDAVPNLLRNPRAVWHAARLAQTADLTAELETLKRRRLPVVVLWGKSDTVIPVASLDSIRAALGDPQVVTVPGSHAWLLADPEAFGEVMTNVIGVPGVPDSAGGPEARPRT